MQTKVKLTTKQAENLNSLEPSQIAGLSPDVLSLILNRLDLSECEKIIAEAKALTVPDVLPKKGDIQRVRIETPVSEMNFDQLLKQDSETRDTMEWKGRMRVVARGRRTIALNDDNSINVDVSIDAFTSGIDRETWSGKRMVTLDQLLDEQPRYLPWSSDKLDPGSVWAGLTEDELAVVFWAASKPEDRGGIANLRGMEKIVARELRNKDWTLFEDTLAAIKRAKNDKNGRVEWAQCVAAQYQPHFKSGEAFTENNTNKPQAAVGVVISASKKPLREGMIEAFGFEDIRVICVNMNIDYESIEGSTKPSKILDLIEYCGRRDRLVELAQECVKLRPNGNFGVVFAKDAIAQGDGAVAVGAGGVYINGSNTGTINTGGGTFVGRNIYIGGEFVGRDKIVKNDWH